MNFLMAEPVPSTTHFKHWYQYMIPDPGEKKKVPQKRAPRQPHTNIFATDFWYLRNIT